MYFPALNFGIGVVLSVIGFRSIRNVSRSTQYLFAYIPLLFAVQQFAEGILWIILPGSNYLHLERVCTAVFLVTAQVIWPVWIPLSILLIEKNALLRKMLAFLTGIGFLVSLFFAWCFITYGAVARIGGHHICYQQTYPIIFNEIEGYLYVIVVLFPPFLTRFKRLWIMGSAIFISYLITKIYYDNYLISVWCFFASMISLMVYWVLPEIRSKNRVKQDRIN